MSKPWNNWYHCMGNTYGTWLPGDPRGFRTRHHREHVDGDYKFPPPPGVYDELFERSKAILNRPAVIFPRELRAEICQLFADGLRHRYQVEVVALSVGGVHFHLLARFVPVGVDPYEHLDKLGVKLTHSRKAPSRRGGGPRLGRRGLSAYDFDPVPRRVLGLARSWVTRELKQRGHFADAAGGLWASWPKVEPIRSRAHQVAAFDYIRGHAAQRSAVLTQLKR